MLTIFINQADHTHSGTHSPQAGILCGATADAAVCLMHSAHKF